MDKIPFKILGVQQIAIGGLTKEKNIFLWRDLLGLKESGRFINKEHNVDETVLRLGGDKYPSELDIMIPLDPENRPSIHKRPLHHIGIWVDNLEAAMAFLKEQKVRFVSDTPLPGAHGHQVAFIHPNGNDDFPVCGEGVLIELVQWSGPLDHP